MDDTQITSSYEKKILPSEHARIIMTKTKRIRDHKNEQNHLHHKHNQVQQRINSLLLTRLRKICPCHNLLTIIRYGILLPPH